MITSSDWLERYRSGQQSQVWSELRQLGKWVREPEYLPAAQAVCDEMASRARHNIEILVDRLTAQGYQFHSNDDEKTPIKPFYPAVSTDAGMVDWLEQQVGPIPLTLASWIRFVGDVWFVGTHPDWLEAVDADPLVIQVAGSHYPKEEIRESFYEDYDNWKEYSEEDPEHAGMFVLPVSPDCLHKANTSGGEPYGFELPDSCADGMFRTIPYSDNQRMRITETFVEYLNKVFSRGGFWHIENQQLQNQLAKDLLFL
ncbi:MAG: hypothetical protein FWG14_12945 [Peptococcaceae bacterium]|nr:hypothetical protein [Peptococcaceae bacterium]